MTTNNSDRVEAIGQDAFFLSASLSMQKLRAQAELLAQTDVPVLIVGEKGSGKKTVARLIHKLSVRSGFHLIQVSCATMPASMLAEEIFGDAQPPSDQQRSRTKRPSPWEKAALYLDEISALPSALQARLLQALHAGETLVPADRAAAPDVRILAGSSVNLDRALAEKRLREDLYYRLSAFTVQVPPLRQRKEEIALLLRYFMHKLARHYRMPAREFSPSVVDACERHSWPGNLAELESFVKRYLVAGERQLPAPFDGFEERGRREDDECESAAHDLAIPFPSETLPASTRVFEGAHGGRSNPESLKVLIQGVKSEAEQTAIRAALKRTGWNRKAAARLLSISYRTLLYKIEQYQMRASEPFLAPSVAGFPLYGREEKDKGNTN